MQQFFLFCTMLIVTSEAFSKDLYGSRISKSIKRRSTFAHKLIPPNPDRYIFRPLNFPMFPALPVNESPDYIEHHHPPVGYYSFLPKRRNFLSVKKKFTNRKRSRRKKLKHFRPAVPRPANFWPAGPVGFRAVPQWNLANLFPVAFDSPKNPKRFIVWFYPVFIRPRRRTVIPLEIRSCLNLKKHHWTNLTNKNKRSTNNATNDFQRVESKSKTDGSESQDGQSPDPVLKPRSFELNRSSPFTEGKFQDMDKNKYLNLDSAVNFRYNTFGKNLAEHSDTGTETESPYASVTLPAFRFKYPYDPLVYEPSLRSSQMSMSPIKETLGKLELEEETTKKPADGARRDILKLKQMLQEVESLLKYEGGNDSKLEKPEVEGLLGKSRVLGPGDAALEKKNQTVHTLKEKIDLIAIPILTQISEYLARPANYSSSLKSNGKYNGNGNDTDTGNDFDNGSDNGNENSKDNSKGKGQSISKSKGKSSGKASKKVKEKSSEKNSSTSDSSKPSKPKSASPRCSADGTWTSSALGLELTFTTLPNLMLKVNVVPKTNAVIDKKWSIQGLTLSKRGGPLLLAAIYPQGRKIASFIGQCKMCQDQDLIFGSWTIFSCVRRFTDLWKAVETKLDILRKTSFQLVNHAAADGSAVDQPSDVVPLQ